MVYRAAKSRTVGYLLFERSSESLSCGRIFESSHRRPSTGIRRPPKKVCRGPVQSSPLESKSAALRYLDKSTRVRGFRTQGCPKVDRLQLLMGGKIRPILKTGGWHGEK